MLDSRLYLVLLAVWLVVWVKVGVSGGSESDEMESKKLGGRKIPPQIVNAPISRAGREPHLQANRVAGN